MISRKKIILKSEDLHKEKQKSDEFQDSGEDFFKENDFQDENTWFSLDQLLSVSIIFL